MKYHPINFIVVQWHSAVEFNELGAGKGQLAAMLTSSSADEVFPARKSTLGNVDQGECGIRNSSLRVLIVIFVTSPKATTPTTTKNQEKNKMKSKQSIRVVRRCHVVSLAEGVAGESSVPDSLRYTRK